ncbi:MAG: hypothetical protein DRQ78_11325, partial [Epsilonproteobacteria bacterium]
MLNFGLALGSTGSDPTAYRIVSLSEITQGQCDFAAGDTCTASAQIHADTVNAAGAETFTWSGYVVGGELPYKEDGTMSTDVDGTRRLDDVGDTPLTDTISDNGQGLKPNGTDQTVTIPINADVYLTKVVDGVYIHE